MASGGENLCLIQNSTDSPPSPSQDPRKGLSLKVSPSTQDKVLIKAYKTGDQQRINHVKTLMRSFSGTPSNGEATNQATSVNVTP